MTVETIETATQIEACFRAIQELRPHIRTTTELVERVQRQMEGGYILVGIREGDEYVSVVGFRHLEHLAFGKYIYIDDLVSLSSVRGKGYARQLLDYVRQLAIDLDYDAVHLDSGPTRTVAHKVYFNAGYTIGGYHFAMKLK